MIDGFEIGHWTRTDDGWLTGCTVVLCRAGAMGGVDVRGGGPGTRETDLLDPRTVIQQVHGVVLTGGSAYGLAAADGVMSALEAQQIGFPVGTLPSEIVPIVPAAVIFDLGRGGEFGHRPDAAAGAAAVAAASSADPQRGNVGAGTGAVAGGLKGGFGYAELRTRQGFRVAAAVAVNAAGSVVDPGTGRLWGDRRRDLATPTDAERDALATLPGSGGFATTIGVVMTDADLSKAQANKVAGVAHDGMARAIRPLHSMLDGDTAFCLASGERGLPEHPMEAMLAVNDILSVAADVFSDAIVDAIVSASSVSQWQSYADLAPTAVGA